MPRRSQLIPWKAAGRVSDGLGSGEVVREHGWIFNSATGDDVTLEEFVATGDREVPPYLETFGLRGPETKRETLIEIGAGIGRMTCAFTREYSAVVACDLDSGFLERCYETVGRFGKVERLRTLQVADGRTLEMDDSSVDVAFSYLTLQHCSTSDALDLTTEAVRVVRPGGKVALNYRGPSTLDPLLLTVGGMVRGAYRVPGLDRTLANNRPLTRLAWQASRMHPDQVTAQLGGSIQDATVWTNPMSKLVSADAEMAHFDGINQHHWWLVATVA